MKTLLSKEQKEANKLARIAAKQLAKENAIIEAEKNQKEVAEITINIEWKKSKMWGSNPNCEAAIKFKDGSYETSPTYKASGCGYDKESTVIADVFNQYLKYKLYKKLIPIDGYLNGEKTEIPYGIYQRADWKYYNGGIGTDCYYKISAAIGGKFERISSGKTFDVYKYTDIKNL